ncbi:MAG: hypothetical protein LBK52_01310, partial [Deltaproteobacteria bacterium]|nr:hypothetical protein [Deltaproteobacteria bacterium]
DSDFLHQFLRRDKDELELKTICSNAKEEGWVKGREEMAREKDCEFALRALNDLKMTPEAAAAFTGLSLNEVKRLAALKKS